MAHVTWQTLISLILTAAIGFSCARSTPRVNVSARLAAAAANLAEEQLGADERQAAAASARRSLALIEDLDGEHETRARALLVLGVATDDPAPLAEALTMLERMQPGPMLWAQRGRLARLSLEQGRPHEALHQLDRTLGESDDWEPLIERARSEAPLHHLRAAVLRQLQRDDDAFAAERNAFLSLSILPDVEARVLRQRVALALAGDHARRAAHERAFEEFARASQMARSLDRHLDEYAALAGMGRTLRRMGWALDAAGHAQRAVERGRGHVPVAELRALGAEALGWLETLSDPMADERRSALNALLRGLEADGPG